MNLPPRIKTLYPNTQNIVYDVETPIPIESAFFLEDAEKDPVKANRYHFKFPGNWITANNGEKIIGVRDIWMIKRKRRLEFSIWLFKIYKSTYSGIMNKFPGHHSVKEIYLLATSEQTEYKAGYQYDCNELKVVYEISEDDDLSKFGDVIIEKFKDAIKNEWQTSIIGSSTIYNENDIKVSQYYDSNGYHINVQYNENEKDEQFYFYFQLGSYNEDFKEVFNIGDEPTDNKFLLFDKKNLGIHFETSLHFKNIWDRTPCKIYSSVAEQSLHQYVGNSNVYFSPIKYYKIRSTDQTFWVDFVSATRYNLPIKLPKHESFCIEMQFLPYDKMLQI